MSTTPNEDRDDLGWDRERDGRMRDFATDDDVVTTRPYDPEKDGE